MSKRFCTQTSCVRVSPKTFDVHTWTLKESLLKYAKHGKSKLVLEAYKNLSNLKLNSDGCVLVSALKACANQGAYIEGRLIHAQVAECGLELTDFLASALISFYFKLKCPEDGQRVFDGLQTFDIVIWNAMIAGYAQCDCFKKVIELFGKLRASDLKSNTTTWNTVIGACARCHQYEEAFQLFYQMIQEGCLPEDFTFASILNACANMEAQCLGKILHVYLIENRLSLDVFLGNTLINFYVKCKDLMHARMVFETLPQKDCVTWNVLISGYSLHGCCSEALVLFDVMQKRGYSPDHVTWNALLTGLVQQGLAEKALLLFERMQEQGGEPDCVTFIHMLKACTFTAAIKKGMLLHAHLMESSAFLELVACNALIDMYAKCGSLPDACTVFQELPKRDLVSWNSILSANSVHNNFKAVLEVFAKMQSEGFQPDEVTLFCVLSACSRGGFVKSGCSSLLPMLELHGISLKQEQYSSMVDLLGRKGFLQESLSLLDTGLLTSHLHSWSSLLSQCQIYGDVGIGRQCFDHILTLDPHYTSAYELMSALYADMGMCNDVSQIQQLKKFTESQIQQLQKNYRT